MAKWKTEFKNQLQFEVDALLNKKVSKRAASNRKGFLLLNRQEEKFLREKGQIATTDIKIASSRSSNF